MVDIKRANKLLLDAAKALANGADPFNHDWLVENNVTLDECMSLSERMAIILKGFLGSDKDEQMNLLAIGAVYGEEGIDLNFFKASIKLAATTRKLKALK